MKKAAKKKKTEPSRSLAAVQGPPRCEGYHFGLDKLAEQGMRHTEILVNPEALDQCYAFEREGSTECKHRCMFKDLWRGAGRHGR